MIVITKDISLLIRQCIMCTNVSDNTDLLDINNLLDITNELGIINLKLLIFYWLGKFHIANETNERTKLIKSGGYNLM